MYKLLPELMIINAERILILIDAVDERYASDPGAFVVQ